MRVLSFEPSEWGMDELGDPWIWAADQARLTDVEQRRLAIAVDEDEGLREELTYLLGQLSTDLSGPFLRELADRLPEESADCRNAAVYVIPALEGVVAGGISARRTWDG